MHATDLKRKDGADGFGDAALVPAAGQRSAPPGSGPWRWLTALVLSLLIHAVWVLLLWAFCGGSAGGTGPCAIVDTRVVAAGPEVDFLISFPDDASKPQPKVLPPAPTPPPAVATVKEPVTAAADAPTASTLSPEIGQGPPRYEGPGDHEGHDRGPGAAGAFFQIPVREQRMVFVIDRSASMGLNGAFAAARRELLACLEQLAPESQFQVIAYNRGAETLRVQGQSGLLTASVDRKRQARHLLEGLRAEGGTDHLAALKRALLLRPDAIFFLTDADDLTPAQVREVTRFNGGRTVIHTVELTGSPRGQAPHPLQLLAAHNRGIYRGVDLARGDPD